MVDWQVTDPVEFLELDNASVAAVTNDAVYHLVMAVATSECYVHQIASRLQHLAQRP